MNAQTIVTGFFVTIAGILIALIVIYGKHYRRLLTSADYREGRRRWLKGYWSVKVGMDTAAARSQIGPRPWLGWPQKAPLQIRIDSWLLGVQPPEPPLKVVGVVAAQSDPAGEMALASYSNKIEEWTEASSKVDRPLGQNEPELKFPQHFRFDTFEDPI